MIFVIKGCRAVPSASFVATTINSAIIFTGTYSLSSIFEAWEGFRFP